MSDSLLRYVPQAEGHVSPFGQAVDAMHVSVTSSDGNLYAEMNGWYAVRVSIAPGHAERQNSEELEAALTRLARLLFVERTREYYRLMEVHLQPNPLSLRRLRDHLETSVQDAPVSGTAAGGQVEVASVGMRHFVVTLAPGVGASLGSEGLSSAVTTAANAMVAEWLVVLAKYKQERWER